MLSTMETEAIEEMLVNLANHESANLEKLCLYRAENLTQSLGISVPRGLEGLEVAPGWIRLAIDSLQERIRFEGWSTSQQAQYETLKNTVRENDLESETRSTILDALIYGVGFMSVGRGDISEGEPEVLVMNESVFSTTYLMNSRTRKPKYALKITGQDKDTQTIIGVLYTTKESIGFVAKRSSGSVFSIENIFPLLDERGNEVRSSHGLGMVPIVPIVNRKDTASRFGHHSEITQSMRNVLQSAMRTILRVEVQSEFFSFPQRALLNVPENMLIDENGKPSSILSMMAGQQQVFPSSNSETREMKAHTWEAHSPSGQIEVLKTWAASFSAEASIPQERLGISSSANPTSAEALKTMLDNLLTKAESRIIDFKGGFNIISELIARVIGKGEIPEGWEPASAKFRDPKTPTLAQATDSIVKQVQTGIIPPTSRIVLETMGYDAMQIDTIIREREAYNSIQSIQNLLALGTPIDDIVIPVDRTVEEN